MPSDPETILDALAGGMSVPKAAHQFDVSEVEVREILKDAVDRCYDGARMRETWMLEDRRLAAVGLKFYHRAMEGDGDPQAAIVFVKTSERRATLAGANMPSSHVLQVVSQPPEAMSSTDEVEAVLDALCGRSVRERQLMNRQLCEKLSAEEEAELAKLRSAREQARVAQLGHDPGSESLTKPH